MDTSKTKTTPQASEKTGNSEPRECEKHGTYESRHIIDRIWTRCPQCVEERQATERAATADRQKREAHEALLRRLQCSEIPRRFAEASFESYDARTEGQVRARDIAQGYAESIQAARADGTCLVFAGRAGTGKTHLAISIAQVAIHAGYTALFTSVMRATRAVKETFRRDSETTERQAVGMFVNPDLLILDEVGVQFGSDTEKLILFEIINSRYEEIKPTIVISNLAKEGLEEFLGERAFDRLRENGGKLVIFDWDSYRRQGA